MKPDTVLIVDDEADISLILKLQLEDAGYTTVRAHDGFEALECLSRQDFDLMLLDIKMPRLNGIQVLEKARQDYPDVAVVMMTAHGNEAIAVEAMKKGATDYFAKPFSFDDAIKKVERAIAFNRARLENRKLQEELAREQQKVAAILEGMGDILVAIDSEGVVMMVNRRASEVLEVARADLIGRKVADILKADIPAENLPCIRVLDQAEASHDLTYTLNLKGRSIPVLANASPLVNPDGTLLGSVEIIRDISALRALEQEKEDFVSMLTHDLKSPITAIVGSLDLVREGRLGAVTHDQQEFLDSAVESCSEMVEMIDTLLDVHKLEAGKMAIAPEPNDPADLLQGVVEKYQAVADRMQISLSLEVAENLPSVAFDRSVMTRLVGNLLSNAFKFTDEQGKIQITVRGIDGFGDNLPETLRRLYKEKVAIDPGTGFLMISVTDNGIGIPSDALENIFDRFAQAKNRQKGKTRGTGLGLTFCRKVMDAHHGYIWAESTEGQGSTFSLLLPGSLDENRDNNATTGARYEQ